MIEQVKDTRVANEDLSSVQISDIQVNGQSDDMTAKEKLLLWSQRMVEGYQGLRCDNFTTSWRDGKLFNAIIHKHRWDINLLHNV